MLIIKFGFVCNYFLFTALAGRRQAGQILHPQGWHIARWPRAQDQLAYSVCCKKGDKGCLQSTQLIVYRSGMQQSVF
jgi:hypothetical protein